MSGPSRLLLTRVVREGTVWNVFVATSAQSGAENVTQLEFEAAGADRKMLRYTRPVDGALLDALHNGMPVRRASLEEELSLALQGAGAASGQDPAAPDGDESTGPATDDSPDRT